MKKKILLLVASALLVMLVLGCPNESTEPEVSSPPVTTLAQQNAVGDLATSMVGTYSFLEIEDLHNVGITGLESARYELVYTSAFVAKYADRVTAQKLLRAADADTYAGYAAFQEVTAALQDSVTSSNLISITTISAEEIAAMNALSYWTADTALTAAFDIEDLVRLGIEKVKTTSDANYAKYEYEYKKAFVKVNGGKTSGSADGDATVQADCTKAETFIDLATRGGSSIANSAEWTKVMLAIQAAVTTGNAATIAP